MGFGIKIPEGNSVHIGDVAEQGGIFLSKTRQIVVEKPAHVFGIEVVETFPVFGVKNVNQ